MCSCLSRSPSLVLLLLLLLLLLRFPVIRSVRLPFGNRGEPLHGVPVVKGPVGDGDDDGEEQRGGPELEGDEEGLLDVADDPADRLEREREGGGKGEVNWMVTKKVRDEEPQSECRAPRTSPSQAAV